MKKKLLSVLLAFVFVFSSLMPVFADTKEDYLSDLQKLYEKNTGYAKASQKLIFGVSTEEIKELEDMGINNLNLKLNVDADSKVSLDPYRIEMKMKLGLEGFDDLMKIMGNDPIGEIPEIKLTIDEKELYVNKEIVNYFLKMSGVSEEDLVKEDYVKIDYTSEWDKNTLDAYKNMQSKLIKDNDEIEKASINLLRKIDLGDVKLNFEKLSDGKYQIKLNSDELVDVIDAFIRFTLSDFDVFLDFYKAIGIDIVDNMNATYTVIGMPEITEENLKAQLAESLKEYEKNAPTFIKDLKKIIKGTQVIAKESFSEDGKYNSEYYLNIVVNLKELKDLSPIFEDANGKINITLNSKQDTIYTDKLEIKCPENAEELDLSKFENKVPETPASYYETRILISPRFSSFIIYGDDEVIEEGIIDVKIVDGKTVCDGQKLADLLDCYYLLDDKTYEDIASQKEFNIRDIENNESLNDFIKIGWDAKTKSISLTF